MDFGHIFSVQPNDPNSLLTDAIVGYTDNNDRPGGSRIAQNLTNTFPTLIHVLRPALGLNRTCTYLTGTPGTNLYAGSVSNYGNAKLIGVVVSNLVNGTFQYVLGPTNLDAAKGLAFSNRYALNPSLQSSVQTLVAYGQDEAGLLVTASLSGGPPPGVALQAPTNEALYPYGANVSMNVSTTNSNGAVVQVYFFADSNLMGSSLSPFMFTWSNAPPGRHWLTARAVDSNCGIGDSVPVAITVGAPLDPPVFSMSSSTYAVSESAGFVVVTVTKTANSGPGSVTLRTRDRLATAGVNGSGDYMNLIANLGFAAGDTATAVAIVIYDDTLSEGNHDFEVFLSNPTGGGSLGAISNAIVTILDDDLPAANGSLTNNVLPRPLLPTHNASLQVFLQGANGQGQWRFTWERIWRDGGAVAPNLPTGNYEIEFKPLLHASVPAGGPFLIPILPGEAVVTNFTYGPDPNTGSGSLRITIYPASVANSPNPNNHGQWRIRGENVWHDSGLTNGLPVGSYVVDFKPVADPEVVWVTPLSLLAVISSNQINEPLPAYSTYTLGEAVDGIKPSPLPASFPTLTNAPYLYCGQILSGAGYGSGFVVKERVVLTAAHVVFEDANLTFFSPAWFFQQQLGSYEPPPIFPRGACVRTGYAARRAQETNSGNTSLELRNLDVATLYFQEDALAQKANYAGRGGYGGYLASNAATNEWLSSHSGKLLAGYPIEGPGVEPGKLCAVVPMDYQFRLEQDRVYSTTDFSSYPGNSGGAICVQYGTNYYPAAVYLGGFSKSMVRTIDSNVVDLITQAEIASNGGGDSTGGGVIRVLAKVGTNGTVRGSAQVLVGPPSAIAAGAAWRIGVGATNFLAQYRDYNTSTNPLNLAVLSGLPDPSFTVEFTNIAGFTAPVAHAVSVVSDMNVEIPATYTAGPARLFITTNSLSITGTHGTAYRIEYQNSLRPGGAWSTQHAQLVISNGTSAIVPQSVPPPVSQRFYRAVWLDQY